MDADSIWKGVTSLSKAGKRRGRGKGAGKKIAKDLNKGQVIGVGPVNMVWPGLNAPLLRGREIVQMRKLPQNKDFLVELLKIRNEMDTYKKRKQHPLDRGWSGGTVKGKWYGPPDPVGEETFEGFDSKVLMVKNIIVMKPTCGRSRIVKVMVVTGNKNGLAGFAVIEGKDNRSGLRRARNMAAQRLRFVERDSDGDTLSHDFVSQYRYVKVFAYKKPEGYGIVAHRCIKAICEVIGIRNIYCKVEGPTYNYVDITKAFFLGLCEQKSFQEMADEKKLHVVELKPETDYYPRVVASPSDGVVRKEAEIDAEEVTDFRMYLNNGQVIEIKPQKYPDYIRTQGYVKYLTQWYKVKRNRQEARVYLRAKYGQLDSFLTVREKEERAKRKAALALEQGNESSESTAASG